MAVIPRSENDSDEVSEDMIGTLVGSPEEVLRQAEAIVGPISPAARASLTSGGELQIRSIRIDGVEHVERFAARALPAELVRHAAHRSRMFLAQEKRPARPN